jgi:hypothetical protein
LHTEMRARAAGFAYKLGVASMLIVSGGHNVGVRYSLKDNKILPEPSLNPFARIKARLYPSEARVMAGFLHENYGIPWNARYWRRNPSILNRTQRTARESLGD